MMDQKSMADELKQYDKNIKAYIKGLTKDFRKETRSYRKDSQRETQLLRHDMEDFRKDIKAEFQKQTKALTEHFDWKVGVIGEQYGSITGDIRSIKQQLVDIQEKVNKIDIMEVDLRDMKDDVRVIKTELEVVKEMLTDPEEQKEYQALTARVYALEHRGVVSS